MPELPEVETTVRGLKKTIVGKKILDVWTDWPKMFKTVPYSKFKREIKGRKIKDVKRRGKNIIFELSGNYRLHMHLKMSGNLLVGKFPNANEPYVHTIFALSGGEQLAFSDIRKFGKIDLFRKKEEEDDLKNLGPEPLERSFTLKKFKERLKDRPNAKIKAVLLDQRVIAGIGNIYSDEILWGAGIHPERVVKDIEEKYFQKMYQAMKKILEKAMEYRGDSMGTYRDIYGRRGAFQHFHRAYRQTGKPCPKRDCSGIIERIKVGGRSAHFCPKHQK